MTRTYCDVCKKETNNVKVAVIELFDCEPANQRVEYTIDLCPDCQKKHIKLIGQLNITPYAEKANGIAR